MANNYIQATLSPDGLELTDDQQTWLAATGASMVPAKTKEGKPGHYVFWEEGFTECPEPDDFVNQLEDDIEDDEALDAEVQRFIRMGGIERVLRGILRNPGNRAIPSLKIDAAATCSRMRIGEFGGFALVVTRKEFAWFSTFSLSIEDGQLEHPPKIISFDD